MILNPNGNQSPESESMGSEQYYEKSRELKGLTNINFADKIMGGQQSQNFLSGKINPLDGMNNFSKKINFLTGMHKMNTEKPTNKLLSSGSNPGEKIESMLRTSKKSKNFESMIKTPSGKGFGSMMSMMSAPSGKGFGSMMSAPSGKGFSSIMASTKSKSFGSMMPNAKAKHFDVKSFIGGVRNNNNKVEQVLGVGKRAFGGINMGNKVSELFGGSKKKNSSLKINNYINTNSQKVNAMNKINSFIGSTKMPKGITGNVFGNPEKYAKTRLKQQKGLSMFGDFDGDKVLNAFDCNPLNHLLQGNVHDGTKYMDVNQRGFINDVANSDNDSASIANLMQEADNPKTKRAYTKTPEHPVDYDAINVDSLTGGDSVPSIAGVMESGDIDAPTFDSSESSFSGQTVETPTIPWSTNSVNTTRDKSSFNVQDEITFAKEKIATSTDAKERRNYTNLLNTLIKQTPSYSETGKEKRANDKLDWDKTKYNDQKDAASKVAEKKQNYEMAKLQSGDKRFNTEFGATQGLKARQQALTEIQADRSYSLEKAKLKMAQQAGDMIAQQKKLDAGKNLMNGLLGGVSTPVDWKTKISGSQQQSSFNPASMVGMDKSNFNPAAMVGGNSQGGMQNAMFLAGAQPQGYGPSQQMKIMQSVDAGQQPSRSYAEKVAESVSTKKPDDFIQQRQEQRVQQQMQPQVQVVPQQIYAPPMQMQQQYAQPQSFGPRQQQYQQPQVDEEYLEYKKKSAAEGFNGYRRGPYKKRQ